MRYSGDYQLRAHLSHNTLLIKDKDHNKTTVVTSVSRAKTNILAVFKGAQHC